jgi:hypothetical protein
VILGKREVKREEKGKEEKGQEVKGKEEKREITSDITGNRELWGAAFKVAQEAHIDFRR